MKSEELVRGWVSGACLAGNPRITARWHKLHPHRLLSEHDQSLYVDANVMIKDRADEVDWMRAALIEAYRHVPRGLGPRLVEAGKSILRFAKKPASFAKRIVLRLLWQRHLARHDHVEPDAK